MIHAQSSACSLGRASSYSPRRNSQFRPELAQGVSETPGSQHPYRFRMDAVARRPAAQENTVSRNSRTMPTEYGCPGMVIANDSSSCNHCGTSSRAGTAGGGSTESNFLFFQFALELTELLFAMLGDCLPPITPFAQLRCLVLQSFDGCLGLHAFRLPDITAPLEETHQFAQWTLEGRLARHLCSFTKMEVSKTCPKKAEHSGTDSTPSSKSNSVLNSQGVEQVRSCLPGGPGNRLLQTKPAPSAQGQYAWQSSSILNNQASRRDTPGRR